MLRPDKRQTQAIKGLFDASPAFLVEYLNYLKLSRDSERLAMETGEEQFNEIQKGKCRILTEQINTLKSLVPKLEDQF